MNWLRNFMNGRYGMDQLSMALLILSFLLSFTTRLVKVPLLLYISYIPLLLCVFRALSRDISKRSMENYKFSMLISPVYSWLKQTQHRARDAKTYKYFRCPKCKTKLRVPRGKGKVIVTCPKCKVVQFPKKT